MREAVLGIIDIALIGGLSWSLWFVIRSSRRRRRQIADQLAAPIVRTADPLVIRINRKEWVVSTAPTIFMTVVGLEAIVSGRTATGLILVAVFLPLLFLSCREMLRRRPVLALDGNGITVMTWKGMTLWPTERFIAWDSIRGAWIKERTSFGVTRHELVCEVVPSEEVEVPLKTRYALERCGESDPGPAGQTDRRGQTVDRRLGTPGACAQAYCLRAWHFAVDDLWRGRLDEGVPCAP
jgi:hypothetical protein